MSTKNSCSIILGSIQYEDDELIVDAGGHQRNQLYLSWSGRLRHCCSHWTCTWGRALSRIQYTLRPRAEPHNASARPRATCRRPPWRCSATGPGCPCRRWQVPSQTACFALVSTLSWSCAWSQLPFYSHSSGQCLAACTTGQEQWRQVLGKGREEMVCI